MGVRSWRFAALASLVAPIWLILAATPASAQYEHIQSYHVSITVEHDGTLAIDERIQYDFGPVPHHGIFRTIPVVYRYDSKQNRVYLLHLDHVTATGGASANVELSRNGADEVIKIGDKDETVTGVHTYDIAYRVEGALNAFPDHDELYWNAIGDEWPVSISDASVRVTAPADIQRVACYAGPSGSTIPCDGSTAR